jgi:hypothetical protein
MSDEILLKVMNDYYNQFKEIPISPMPNGIGEHQIALLQKALDTGVPIDSDIDDWFGYSSLPEGAIV